MEKYRRIRKIGKGNFGDVWLVEDNKGRVFQNNYFIVICNEKNRFNI